MGAILVPLVAEVRTLGTRRHAAPVEAEFLLLKAIARNPLGALPNSRIAWIRRRCPLI